MPCCAAWTKRHWMRGNPKGLKSQGNSGSCLQSSTLLRLEIWLMEIFQRGESSQMTYYKCKPTGYFFFFLRSQSLYLGYFSSLPNMLTSGLGNPPTICVIVRLSCPSPLRSGSSTAIKHILADKTVTKHLIHTCPHAIFFPVNPGLCPAFCS